MLEFVRHIRPQFSLPDPAYILLEFLIPQNAVIDSKWEKRAIEESNMINSDESSLKFWKQRLEACTFEGRKIYPNLKKVVSCIMSLPSSNAAVEKMFRKMKLVKSTTLNALKRESFVDLLHTKEGLNGYSLSSHEL